MLLLSKKELNSLDRGTLVDLLDMLYTLEDKLDYKCKKVTKTINYLQKII